MPIRDIQRPVLTKSVAHCHSLRLVSFFHCWHLCVLFHWISPFKWSNLPILAHKKKLLEIVTLWNLPNKEFSLEMVLGIQAKDIWETFSSVFLKSCKCQLAKSRCWHRFSKQEWPGCLLLFLDGQPVFEAYIWQRWSPHCFYKPSTSLWTLNY